MTRPPLPPFTEASAIEKVRLAEDGWNNRDPAKVALAYTPDSTWRNRAEFITGRAEIEAFLTRKWNRELDYRLIKELWAWHENRIAVRYAYEWRDDSGQWFRSYGNENWEFDEAGLMRKRFASINDLPITRQRTAVSLGARPPARRSSRSVAAWALIACRMQSAPAQSPDKAALLLSRRGYQAGPMPPFAATCRLRRSASMPL